MLGRCERGVAGDNLAGIWGSSRLAWWFVLNRTAEGGLSSEVKSKEWRMVFVNNQSGFSLVGRVPIMADGHRTSEWLKFVYQILSPSIVNLSYIEGVF